MRIFRNINCNVVNKHKRKDNYLNSQLIIEINLIEQNKNSIETFQNLIAPYYNICNFAIHEN